MAASLSGNVFIVTGSASGMGLATAKTLLARGAMVGLCDVNEPGLQKMVSALEPEQKDRAFAQALDVTSREAVRAFLQTTKKHFGKLDGIANFAGTGGHNLGKETVWETEVQEYDFIMDLNVKAVFNILGEALKPGVLEEPASIVHITSMYAERGYLKGAVFTASKHAANGMIKSAAMEAGDRGIRVNAVMPGLVDTPMARAGADSAPVAVSPIPRPGKPEEVASVVAFLLSNEGAFVTGATWAVDGGANACGRHN